MFLPQDRQDRVVTNAALQNGSKPFAVAVVAALALMGVALTSDAEAQVLGTAESFAVLGAETVTNTGNTEITGDLGLSPGSSITGFFGTTANEGPGIVFGTIHQTDATAASAQVAADTLFATLMGMPTQFVIPSELGGKTYGPGVYSFVGGFAQITGLLTLNGLGNSDSQFIFKIDSTLITASGSRVLLFNGADPNKVFWAVGSSATLGSDSVFQGTIVALTSISLNARASITCGRALAREGAVTMIDNTVTLCVPGSATPVTPGDTGVQTGTGEVVPGQDISLDELFGEGVSGAQQTAFGASRLFGSAMLAQAAFFGQGPQTYRPEQPQKYHPLKLGPSESEPERIFSEGYQPRTWRVWGAGLGGTTSLDGDAGAADLDTDTAGVAAGLDYRINRTTLVGIAGGYTNSDLSVDQLQTKGDVEGTHVGLYGVKWFGQVYLAGIGEYGHFNNKTRRFIDWIVDEREDGSFESDGFGGRFEAGWAMPVRRYNVTPFVGLDVFHLESDSFTETSHAVSGGAGILGARFDSESVTSTVSSVGIQLDTQYLLRNGRVLTPFVRVAWLHEFDPDRSVGASLILSPLAAFTADGASAAEDAARVTAGLKLDITQRIALFGFFEGEFSDRGQSYAGVGGGDVAFAGSGQGQNYAGRVGMRVAW